MRFSVRHELDSIRRLLRRDRRQIQEDQLQQYSVDGALPTDPLTLSYLRLTEASVAAMDASVGGQNYEEAVERYEQSLERYRQAVRGATL